MISKQANQVEIDKAQQRKGRMIFLLIAIFFAVPILVVVLMIKYDWKPSGQSVGELIRPARLLTVPETIAAQTEQATDLWGDKWNMVFVADQCHQLCMNRLQDMRQIHVSTYKQIFRVQRILLTTQSDVTAIQQQFPKLIIVNQTQQDVAELAKQFNIYHEDALLSNRVYFVDPLGHAMMTYPLDIEAKYIRKDLMKLLKFSWSG